MKGAPGRRRVYNRGEDRRTVPVRLYVPASQYARLVARAEQEDATLSAVCADALDSWLDLLDQWDRYDADERDPASPYYHEARDGGDRLRQEG